LDAAGPGKTLFWWDCSAGRDDHMVFSMPPNDQGPIRMAAHPTMCVDVPGGNAANGAALQLWGCATAPLLGNMLFEIREVPQDPVAPDTSAPAVAMG
jgi:hypothetical protein